MNDLDRNRLNCYLDRIEDGEALFGAEREDYELLCEQWEYEESPRWGRLSEFI
jgi:hypothetical protein